MSPRLTRSKSKAASASATPSRRPNQAWRSNAFSGSSEKPAGPSLPNDAPLQPSQDRSRTPEPPKSKGPTIAYKRKSAEQTFVYIGRTIFSFWEVDVESE